MPVYIYRASTRKGQIVRNRVEEPSKQSLIKKLKRNNLIPISIIQVNRRSAIKKVKKSPMNAKASLKGMDIESFTRRKEEKSFWKKTGDVLFSSTKITTKDISSFTQSFYLLKKANFNNIHALSAVIETTENQKLRVILEDILAGVETGESMYATMEYYADVFPYIYINMIKVGELSGSLTTSLGQAVKYLESSEGIRKKLKKILIPNIIQFVGLLILLFAGTVLAIPQIQKLFDSMGSTETLPGMTVAFSNFITFLMKIWYIPTAVFILTIVLIFVYIRTPKGKYNFHYFKYTMPVFGRLMYMIDLSRFLKALLLNLQNGMRIQDAIEVSKNVISNYVMLSIIEIGRNNILIGDSWLEPFEKVRFHSNLAIEMLKIGMKSDLSEMMEKVVEYTEVDINNTMDRIISILPQIVYGIVGIVMIFFVVVVLVPVIQVYMGTFLFSAAGL